MSDDAYQQFAERINDELEYEMIVKHDGEVVGKIEGLSIESVIEQTHKFDKMINDYIQERAEDFPEPEYYSEDEDEKLGNNGEPLPPQGEDARFEAIRENTYS